MKLVVTGTRGIPDIMGMPPPAAVPRGRDSVAY